MIVPVLKDLDWDSAEDLNALALEDGEEFAIQVTATIGVSDQPDGDLFRVTVISPKSLTAMAHKGPRFLRHYLLAANFDVSSVRDQIERLCRRCPGEDWNTVGTKLSRFMAWEFEDYREYQPR